MIRTKIVATIGPACTSEEQLTGLLAAGVDVFRLNFSHGDLESHARALAVIRAARRPAGQTIAVLGDLCGPKVRLGPVADHDGTGGMPIATGDTLVIQRQPIEGRDGRVSTTYAQLIDDVNVGDRVLIEDGLLRFLVTDKATDEATCQCTVGGILKSSKGVNLPNTAIGIPSITERDWQCVKWAIDNGLDFLALSFVRRAGDVRELCDHLAAAGSSIAVIAKIEKFEAVREIDAILQAAQGLMVARGDLGVEMDVAQVPLIQKDLIRRCRLARKPVIVATQMLQSMIDNPSPTRAEVSDVANAIFDGADATMLSGETAVGRYPLATVHMMNHVAETTEQYLATTTPADHDTPAADGVASPRSALARGAWRIARDLNIKLVAIWTASGATARAFSKHRFCVPLVALSPSPSTVRQLSLCYGVHPHQIPDGLDSSQILVEAVRIAHERHGAVGGDRILLVAGWSTAGELTNGMVIHTMPK